MVAEEKPLHYFNFKVVAYYSNLCVVRLSLFYILCVFSVPIALIL